MGILVIYWLPKSDHKTQLFQTTNMYFLIYFLTLGNLGTADWGASGPEILMRLQSDSQRGQSLKPWLELGIYFQVQAQGNWLEILVPWLKGASQDAHGMAEPPVVTIRETKTETVVFLTKSQK